MTTHLRGLHFLLELRDGLIGGHGPALPHALPVLQREQLFAALGVGGVAMSGAGGN